MSTVIQVGGIDPEVLWRVGALPLAVGADLILGDVPGRTLALNGLNRLTAIVGGRTERLVRDLGGGRGGDLFGGALLTLIVVGTTAGVVGLLVDLADAAGGPISMTVRAVLIATGLAIRVPGECILQAAEAPDRDVAARWLATAGGHPPTHVDRFGVERVAVAATGELMSGLVVGPLVWLVIGGPAGLWGFVAVRLLRETLQGRGDRSRQSLRVPVALADLAEFPAALIGLGLIGPAAAVVRADPGGAWREGWRLGRGRPLDVPRWCQAGLAGALGVAVPVGRMFARATTDAVPPLERSTRLVDATTVAIAVRIWQVVALMAAASAMIALAVRG